MKRGLGNMEHNVIFKNVRDHVGLIESRATGSIGRLKEAIVHIENKIKVARDLATSISDKNLEETLPQVLDVLSEVDRMIEKADEMDGIVYDISRNYVWSYS